MAVTTTYTYESVFNIDGDANADPAVTGLSGGGFAIASEHAGHVDVHVYNASGAETATWTQTGSNPSIAELNNGNIVVATQDSDSIRYAIHGPAGAVVFAEVDIGDDGPSVNPHVTALPGGGFAIVSRDTFAGSDKDIDLNVYDSSGVFLFDRVMDDSEADDRLPVVAGLVGGEIAVVWQYNNGSATEIWYRIFDSAGNDVQDATQLDDVGDLNSNPSVVALPDGGFAVAYADDGWLTGFNDISFAKIEANGDISYITNVTDPEFAGNNSNDDNPALALLANGLVALAYEDNEFGDTDNVITVIDPSDGSLVSVDEWLTTGGVSVSNDISDISISPLTSGRVVVVHSDANAGDVRGEVLDVMRQSTSDGAGDHIVGDAFVDFAIGNGGNDTIEGRGGDDSLFGGFGADRLDGGAGDDFLRSGPQNDRLEGGGGDDILGGSIRHDRLFGDGGADLLIGSNGNDKLDGGASRDTLVGGNGRDTLIGGAGQDRMNGGGGRADTADYSGATGAIGIDLVAGAGSGAEANGDVLVAIENVRGGAFDDTLGGDNGRNVLRGGDGDDRLDGGGGDDVLTGDAGADTLTGGAGDDQFWFRPQEGADHITDFVAGAASGDVVRLLQFGADFDTFAEVMAVASQSGGDVVFDFGGGSTLTLVGVTFGDLDADDFIL